VHRLRISIGRNATQKLAAESNRMVWTDSSSALERERAALIARPPYPPPKSRSVGDFRDPPRAIYNFLIVCIIHESMLFSGPIIG